MPVHQTGRGELSPRRLRIYANRTNIIDFSEVEDATPQLNLSLLEGETGVTEYPLRTASFANIHSLSLFFVSSVFFPPPTFFSRSGVPFEPLTAHRVRYGVRCSWSGMQSDATGGDALRLYFIGFRGDSRSQRKEGTQKLEIPAAVSPDAKLIDRLQEKSGGQQTTAR